MTNSKKILFIILFLIALATRTVFKLGPNIELVTTVMLLSCLYLGRKESLWLVLLIMVISDLILGNTNIFVFTWTGFLIPVLFASNIMTKTKLNKIFLSTSLGIFSNIFFFMWTNFGVWLLDSWRMYPKTITGLITCYINGLPFLKNQIVSSLIFIPLGVFAIEITKAILTSLKPNLLAQKIRA
jgi:hypothetical protein